jgi:cytochrome c-type biogenesis protein CcmF
MLLANVGVAVFIVGVTLVKGYEVERDVRLDPGQSTEVGGYSFTLKGVAAGPGPNYQALIGTVEVRRGGVLVDVLAPEKRVYAASGQSMTEAAIRTRFTGDLYVSLGEPVTADGIAGAWGVRIYVKPFIDWIWGGCILMALGGFLAIADRRYRIAVRERVASAVASARA